MPVSAFRAECSQYSIYEKYIYIYCRVTGTYFLEWLSCIVNNFSHHLDMESISLFCYQNDPHILVVSKNYTDSISDLAQSLSKILESNTQLPMLTNLSDYSSKWCKKCKPCNYHFRKTMSDFSFCNIYNKHPFLPRLSR